jgi:hypothetical protein
MKDDSIEGIYDTLKQTAKISQSAGGIGLAIHNIRATGSYIGGTNAPAMIEYRCFVYLMILPVMLTRCVASAKEHSLFILNPGMPMYSSFSI